jgi:predicted AAA+ superfamily ATPase
MVSLKRIVCDEIIDDLERREIGIIIGPRQVGKTTLLKEIANYCRTNGIQHDFFDLEIPDGANYFSRPFPEIYFDLTKRKRVVLIDEFHYLPNATRLFKAVYDSGKKTKIFASGSSAIEMHRHLKESLAGRRHLYRLFPLSFSEWLPSRSKLLHQPANLNTRVDSQTHRRLKKLLGEFIVYGGMPGLVHEKTEAGKKRLLLDLVATYIQKDIKSLLREEDILSFNRLLLLLAGREGGLLSENGVSRDLNYSLRQVRKDLSILQQMFLLDALKPYYTNRGRELKQTNKIYFFDTGIRNAILRDFRRLDQRPDKGAMLESFVLHELQKNLGIAQEIYYWRTRQKDEVDFILVENRVPMVIEVKSKINAPEIPVGVGQFMARYPECRLAVVLNDNLTAEIRHHGSRIIFRPHYYAALIPLAGEGYHG